MISSSIDGSVGGSSQLLDLLSLISDTKAYDDKLQALEAATAENKKYVELVAPASDIVYLREALQKEYAAAKEELLNAKQSAAEIVKSAEADAASVRDSANTFANDIKAQAQRTLNDAQAQKADVEKAISDAQAAEKQSVRNASELRKLAADAKTVKESAAVAQAEAEQVKADLIAKHQGFIDSLRGA